MPADRHDPLVPVPAADRQLGARDAFSLWFSLGIGLLVLQAGALLVPALSLPVALLAIVAGSAAGVLVLAAASVVGADTGLAAMGTLRAALGPRGAAIPAVLNVVQLVGWGAFELIIMRQSADALSRSTFGATFPAGWTVLFGALATWLAVAGPLSVVRRFLRNWGLWLLLAGATWLTLRLLSHADASLWRRPGTGGLSFGGAFDLVVAMPLSWLPLAADYSRFGRSPRAMFNGTAWGYLLANIWFYALGAAYALISGGGEGMLTAALAEAGGGFALLLVLIDETDNAFADIYSAAVSTAALTRGRTTRIALLYGALCTLIALVVPLGRYQDFLYLIGSVFAPLFGVLLTEHFLLRQRRPGDVAAARPGGPFWFTGGFGLRALAAWVLGIAAYQVLNRALPDFGATLPAFLVSAAATAALAGFRRREAAA
jgi:NCS1 family nucleobase:cation symporter-1